MAIAIPVFTAQLDKAKIATEEANARGVYAEAVSDYLSNGYTGAKTYDAKTIDGIAYTAATNNGNTWTVTLITKKSTGGKDSYTYGAGAVTSGE